MSSPLKSDKGLSGCNGIAACWIKSYVAGKIIQTTRINKPGCFILVLTLVVTLTLVHLYILSLAADPEARGDGAWRVTGQGPGHQPRRV